MFALLGIFSSLCYDYRSLTNERIVNGRLLLQWTSIGDRSDERLGYYRFVRECSRGVAETRWSCGPLDDAGASCSLRWLPFRTLQLA
jgi:hypothetical protein